MYLPLVKAIGQNKDELRVLAGIVHRAIEELDRSLMGYDSNTG